MAKFGDSCGILNNLSLPWLCFFLCGSHFKIGTLGSHFQIGTLGY